MAKVDNEVHYKFDVEKMLEFVFKNSKETDTEITETYVNSDGEASTQKTVREMKSEVGSTMTTIRYDLLKVFLGTLIETQADENGQGVSFGETLVINTLLDNGIITTM